MANAAVNKNTDHHFTTVLAHATTPELSYDEHSFAEIIVLECEWDRNEIIIEIELWWQNPLWNGSQKDI